MSISNGLNWTSAGVLSAVAAAGYTTSQAAVNSTSSEGRDQRPNIIVMVVDDMGFSDPGCYGGEINTPNINMLAERGVRFTQFHNCARCCPTRASLLTGLYPHQVGLTRNGNSLSRDGATIAELLRDADYETAMFGKWHLSQCTELENRENHQKWLNHQLDYEPFAPIESYPINRGFEHFYGVIWGVIDHFDPYSLVEDYSPVKEVPENYLFADAITDKAIDFIEENSKTDKPFFMYYAHCAPHWPIHAMPEDIEKYKDTYKDGWEKLRETRFKRQMEIGIFGDQKVELPKLMDNGRTWSKLPQDRKEYEARKMAVHAAMVDRIDQNLGRLLETLKETGQYENTMIVFMSDNGASPEQAYWQPGYDRSGETRDGRKQKYEYDNCPIDEIGSETSYLCIGAPWANAANTPFRFWKKESYEGGSNTPCIIFWPDGLKAEAGSITKEPAHAMDIMPTCLELANSKYPEQYRGHKLGKLGGKSLVPVINGKERPELEEYYFEHEMGRAVRKDGWKLVAYSGKPKEWHLFHIEEDITEMHDVSDKYPEKAKELKAAWNQWSVEVGLKDFYQSQLK